MTFSHSVQNSSITHSSSISLEKVICFRLLVSNQQHLKYYTTNRENDEIAPERHFDLSSPSQISCDSGTCPAFLNNGSTIGAGKKLKARVRTHHRYAHQINYAKNEHVTALSTRKMQKVHRKYWCNPADNVIIQRSIWDECSELSYL